jgi:hypothetical protein
MAFEQALQSISCIVNADMTSKQYYIVKGSTTSVALCTAGVQPLGVLQDTPAASGRPGKVGISGVSKVVAGAAITAGAYVSSDSSGKAVTAASADFALGIARTAAGADGDVISVLLMPQLGKMW